MLRSETINDDPIDDQTVAGAKLTGSPWAVSISRKVLLYHPVPMFTEPPSNDSPRKFAGCPSSILFYIAQELPIFVILPICRALSGFGRHRSLFDKSGRAAERHKIPLASRLHICRASRKAPPRPVSPECGARTPCYTQSSQCSAGDLGNSGQSAHRVAQPNLPPIGG